MAGKYSVPLWRDTGSSEGHVPQQTSALDTYCDCARHWDRGEAVTGIHGLRAQVAGFT